MKRDQEYAAIYEKAHQAGMEAVSKATIVPMVVGQAKSLFSNEIDYSQPTEYVADGVCGFAWVNVRPGNHPFANWLKKNRKGRSDDYYGGVVIGTSGLFNQSMQKKETYCAAMAKVLMQELGNEGKKFSAYMMSRMD
jgi:hypothetical protein